MNWLYHQPHRDRLDLDASDEAPKSARKRLMDNLEKWSLRQFEGSALLVLSEIITNAVNAANEVAGTRAAAVGTGTWPAPRPAITVWLHAGPAVVAMLAWDPSTAALTPQSPGATDESGRGLLIVQALSADWGFYYPAEAGGKVAWATVNRP
jgi:hypothetical protein